MQMYSLPAGGAGGVESEVSPVTRTQNRAPLTNAAFSDITCTQNEIKITSFSEDSRFPSEI